jgi:hypothetical protein
MIAYEWTWDNEQGIVEYQCNIGEVIESLRRQEGNQWVYL